MRIPLLLTCAVSLLATSVLTSAETLMLDAFDVAQSAWGSAQAETMLVKQGKAALRWLPDEGSLRRDDFATDLGKHNSLRLWMYSKTATFARMEMKIPLAGSGSCFTLKFKVDWEGWNRSEIGPWGFAGPTNNTENWGKSARALRC